MSRTEDDPSRSDGSYDLKMVRRLFGFLRPYPVPVTGALAAVVVNSMLQLVPPYLAKVVIDDYLPARNVAGVNRVAFFFLIVLLAGAVLESAQTYILQLTGQRVMFDLRARIFEHLQRLSLGFYDRHPVGRLMTRVTTDVEVVNDLFTSGFHVIFFDLFTLAGIVFVMLRMNAGLAAVTFTVVPLIVLMTEWFRRNVRESFRSVRTWIARVTAFLQEHIVGMATVQLFRGEQRSFRRFTYLNEKHRQANMRAVFYYAVFYPAIEFIATLATALILWYGGAHVLSGSLTLGSLVAFLLYGQRFFRPIADLSDKLNSVQAALAASERIFTLIDTPATIQSPARPAPRPAASNGHIVFDHVWFAYDGEDYVLRDVSFEVRPGERVGVVGATGSGKSTIISLLMRFYDVSRGRILVDGIDVRDMDVAELRDLFGLVLQDVQLFSGTVAANVRMGNLSIDDERLRRAAEAVHVDRFVAELPAGWESAVAERGATFSAGQKQLLSFARALAFDRRILLLDEATSNVDTETELLVRDALRALMAGRTTIAVAHRLSTIHDMNTILVLHRGELREAGSHAELMRRQGLYRQLYELQCEEQPAQREADRRVV